MKATAAGLFPSSVSDPPGRDAARVTTLMAAPFIADASMQAPRGTRDFGPEQMAARRDVEARLRRVFESYGYHEVQTPTFEHLELFTAKSGPGIVDELYAFEDKSDRELALRPELTAPVMRYYFDNLKMAPKPVKLFYVANCFRYDRPQAGRYREFWQMGCELIGDAGPVAVAELVAMGVGLVEAAGLTHRELRLGHLGILRAALHAQGVPADDQRALMRLIDKRDDDALRDALPDAADADALIRLFDAPGLDEVRDALGDADAGGALEEVEAVLANLEALGVRRDAVRVDAGIARGLDYYTGVVFEIDAPKLGAEKQLLGGGVYALADVFDEPPVETAGFALGFDRLLVALDEEGVPGFSVKGPDVYAVAFSEAAVPTILACAARLRAAGARVEVEPQTRAPGKALGRADQLGASFALMAGDRELADGVVAFKNLASGDQASVPPETVADRWAERA